MKKLFHLQIRLLFITTVLLFIIASPSFATDLQMFVHAKWLNHPSNDGDSFLVDINGTPRVLRLYFVDCAETSISATSDARRVREQMRYFGLPNAERTIHFGEEAKTFIEQNLAKPFTVHTAFASALGRSASGRIYGFVTTADGTDLASLLIKNGLARTHGVGRKTPDGISRDEMTERLRDLEISAMLKRAGIWSESDPDRIAELRAMQRNEEQELKELQIQVKKAQAPQTVLDPNIATEHELQSIKGIGPVSAKRIRAGRPYKTVDDLLHVKGIGPKKLKAIRPYFTITETDNNTEE